jgi:hypothetical protein
MQKTAFVIGLTAVLSSVTSASAQNDAADTITTSGFGRLTTCRSWIVYNACTTHKVILPKRIAVGDRVELSFGSNPKNYTFQIAHIRLDGEGCRALSSSSGRDEDGEKLDISDCQPAAK